MEIGERKRLFIEIVRNKRGYFINIGLDNHRSLGPYDDEPTFHEALDIIEALKQLEG